MQPENFAPGLWYKSCTDRGMIECLTFVFLKGSYFIKCRVTWLLRRSLLGAKSSVESASMLHNLLNGANIFSLFHYLSYRINHLYQSTYRLASCQTNFLFISIASRDVFQKTAQEQVLKIKLIPGLSSVLVLVLFLFSLLSLFLLLKANIYMSGKVPLIAIIKC